MLYGTILIIELLYYTITMVHMLKMDSIVAIKCLLPYVREISIYFQIKRVVGVVLTDG